MRTPLDYDEIERRLDDYLEVEFSFRNTAPAAEALAAMGYEQQRFVLDWVRRIASTNIEMGYRFAKQAKRVLQVLDEHMIEAWALHAMDCYDREGLRPALLVMDEVDWFVEQNRLRTSGAVLEEASPILLPFLRGLSGRRLELEEGDAAWTDSETVHLPAVLAMLPTSEENFRLYKAMAAHLWAQTRFGTFRVDLDERLAEFPEPGLALQWLNALETRRLDACIQRELPGLYREMQALRSALDETEWPGTLKAATARLIERGATVEDSLALIPRLMNAALPASLCYQGELRPTQVRAAREARIEREKVLLRVALGELAEELRDKDAPVQFGQQEVEDPTRPEGFRVELTLDGKPMTPPEQVQTLVSSILLDFGEIPEEYLVPAGPGEYDLSLYRHTEPDPEEVWAGAYHEEGAFLYKEWDCKRLHYRKNWCVLRDHEVKEGDPGFYRETLRKHKGLVKSLRRTFELLRGEDKLLKRQTFGEDVDIDALVEAHADLASGMEMTDRLFTRMHKEERNIAVMLMVDMSGSTKGWVNEAERESLILLSESLEMLGDRFAIYGFSGITRKRCEVYRIKAFDDPYDEQVRNRICGIQPKEYTRMGAAIRHLSALLAEVEARTRLLITLSDGKPEDYDGYYRGEYGVEDTRQALFEARRDGIHPFCITIDEEARDYLPHMYGAANFVVVKDVARLPTLVSDIYRKITTQ
ncbi:MAG TPA: nitric oxide reductase activation protein [Chromatiales bacterium]|nr:nitric oxide reductase activation protein [Chromatiales bacterium]